MRNSISENEIEEIALSYLQNLGYSYILGTILSPDGEHPERQYNEVVLQNRLRDAIDKLNPSITQDAKEDALKKVLRTESPNALINNETFHKYLTEGVDVEVRTADGIRGQKVYIVDFGNAENNEFLAINQFTIIEGNQNKRPDIILFVNGLPLIVIELKNAVDENATIKSAYNQLQTYKQTIPSFYLQRITYCERWLGCFVWNCNQRFRQVYELENQRRRNHRRPFTTTNGSDVLWNVEQKNAVRFNSSVRSFRENRYQNP